MKEILKRSISGIFIVVILLCFIYSTIVFLDFCFLFAVGCFMAMEWAIIVQKSEHKNRWFAAGVFYILLSLVPMIMLKVMPDGNHLLMWLFLLVWSTDTFAYVVGKMLKLNKHKISKISPNKSYEGLAGGILGSLLVCYLFANKFLPEYKILLLYFTPVFCCIEQLGDFTESYVKRKFDVKDSGSIIPGHGGFLDRFDGFLYLTIVLVFALRFSII